MDKPKEIRPAPLRCEDSSGNVGGPARAFGARLA